MIIQDNYPDAVRDIFKELESTLVWTFHCIDSSFYFPNKFNEYTFAVANGDCKSTAHNVCIYLNNWNITSNGKHALIPFQHLNMEHPDYKISVIVYSKVETLNLHLSVQNNLKRNMVQGNKILESVNLYGRLEIIRMAQMAAFNSLIDSKTKGAIRGE